MGAVLCDTEITKAANSSEVPSAGQGPAVSGREHAALSDAATAALTTGEKTYFFADMCSRGKLC